MLEKLQQEQIERSIEKMLSLLELMKKQENLALLSFGAKAVSHMSCI